MQYWPAPTPDAACRMRFSCTNVCATARPPPSSPKIAESGTRTSRRVTSAWSVGMLNVHQWKSTEKPGVSTGTKNAVMPARARRRLAGRPGEHDVVGGRVHPGVPALRPVDHPVAAVADGRGLHPRGVAAVVGLGEAEADARRAPVSIGSRNSSRCSAVPNSSTMCTNGKLPTTDDSFCRSLCRPRPAVGEVLADHRHVEVRAVRPADLRRQPVAQPPRGVGPAEHLAEQLLPVPSRDAAALEVGARPLPPVVEEARRCRPAPRAGGSRAR